MAGQLFEGSAEPGYVRIADSVGDLSYGHDAGVEKIPGFRNSAASEVLLIGKAHDFFERPREMGV